MIRHVVDPANAITVAGLALTAIGISFAIGGSLDMAIAAVLWALLADHLDGVVARRTKGRAPQTEQVGKSLDSFADLVSAGVFPAVLLMVASHGSPLSVFGSIVLVLASALRLSHFNLVGSPDGRFIGVPTTYAVPLAATVFLTRPIIPVDIFPDVLAFALVSIGALHVAPIRVPKTAGAMYFVVVIFCVGASIALALRAD